MSHRVVLASLALTCALSGQTASTTNKITLNATPTRVIGQTSLNVTSASPNLVEGREFYNPQSVAVDTSTNPPGLYVSDTANNRVLGFHSAVGFANGKKADIVVGQVDFASTFAAGPGTPRTTGIAAPTGVAVDRSGNLYVADSNNNRILRFPKPFQQTGTQVPDLVIGQSGFTTRNPNSGGISASTLALSGASGVAQVFIAFDATGNLWVPDVFNNRVLRFNASVLGSGAAPGPPADLVLGQVDFVTNSYNAPANPLASLTAFTQPTGIAFDPAGRLFVSESVSGRRSRVLIWNPPFFNGEPATRLLGVVQDFQPPTTSEYQFNTSVSGVFAVGNQIGVADTLNNRLLLFPPVEQWTSNTQYQAASQVIGQPDFSSAKPNQGGLPTGATLNSPTGAFFAGAELYVVDTSNNRMVVLPQSGSGFGPATRVLGQDRFDTSAPNLLEGREFNFSAGDAGLALDVNSSPPHLYVADTGNNRILGFRDLRNIQPGQKADIVIGQPDFQQGAVNYPTNDSTKLNSSGLNFPTGVFVDALGNLYVADTLNGRVLRFPKPFDNYKPGVPQPADLVLGQTNFTTSIPDATARTMRAPFGIAQVSDHGLMVSDVVHNRVLMFPGNPTTFVSGEAATVVLGQPDFTSSASGSAGNQLNAPRHISSDTDDRLYVADTNNARVQIFDHAPSALPGAFAAVGLTAGLSAPRAVNINQQNGDIWVGDAGSGNAYRYPDFNQLSLQNFQTNATLAVPGSPRAVAQDIWGNLFVADALSRVTIYYPGLAPLNAANFLYQPFWPMAPGMIAALYSTGNLHQFGGPGQGASTVPLPTSLNGVQVLFNNVATPLFFAGPDQINFQIPWGAPQNGTADVQVIEQASGRVLGDSLVEMGSASPGIFTQAGDGIGAAVAQNQDGSLNTATNPAEQGSVITVYATGLGFLSNAPPDGQAPGGPVPTQRPPIVIMGTGSIPPENIQYCGLAPTLVGVWQLNLKIPDTTITLPDNPVQVIINQNSVFSGGGGYGRLVEIYVKRRT
jgi:uncharacterized protein (TIGR03437 family)